MLVKRKGLEFGRGHVAQGPATGPSRPRTWQASCFPDSQAAVDKSGFAAPARSPDPSWDQCPIPFLAIRAPHLAPRCYTECLWLTVMGQFRIGVSPALCHVSAGCRRPGWHGADQPGGFHCQRAEGREEGAGHRAATGAPSLHRAGLRTCSDPAVCGVWSASNEMQAKDSLVARPGTYIHSIKEFGQQPLSLAALWVKPSLH